MEQVGEENASRRGASANRWAADAHALALLPTIRTLMAAGFVCQRELANELNRRGIATARGGNWPRTPGVRQLRRAAAACRCRTRQWLGNKPAGRLRTRNPAPPNSQPPQTRLCP